MSLNTIKLWEHYFKDKGYNYRFVRNTFSDWDFLNIIKNDVEIGLAARKNGEAHLLIYEQYRKKWATKGLLKSLREWAKLDHTFVTENNPDGDRLAKFFGLSLNETYNGVKHYVMGGSR